MTSIVNFPSRRTPSLRTLTTLLWGLALTCWFPAGLEAQLDIVITKLKSSEGTFKRKGAIVEWKGLSLTLNSNGREIEIDNPDVVEVQTNWNSDYVDGLKEIKAGNTQVAIVKFEEALLNEKRPWAQRIIRAQLVDAFMLVEKPNSAIQQFLRITAEDPQTRFVHLTPLPWINSRHNLEAPALELIKSPDLLTQLIGASWLTSGKHKAQSLQVLQELANDIDPSIAALATAQLWRVRTGVVAKQADVWQGILNRMPRDVRAGPCLVLANAQSQAGQTDQAIINLMRIPTLHPDRNSISAAALYRMASLLHNKGQSDNARSILQELVTYYPQSIWAQQASK
ncbi:MAG: tetratricopeptide (TPR) repeat protein [Mariniblastus sp.]|jgi:tetratricopeptide (TPR) repeat protein